MIHIFHFSQCDLGFGIVNPFFCEKLMPSEAKHGERNMEQIDNMRA